MEHEILVNPLWNTFWIIAGIFFVIFMVAEIAATLLETSGYSPGCKHKKGKRYRNFKGKKSKKKSKKNK